MSGDGEDNPEIRTKRGDSPNALEDPDDPHYRKFRIRNGEMQGREGPDGDWLNLRTYRCIIHPTPGRVKVWARLFEEAG